MRRLLLFVLLALPLLLGAETGPVKSVDADAYGKACGDSEYGVWMHPDSVSYYCDLATKLWVDQPGKWAERPWFDCTHPRYGMTCDGVADDTVALQACIDAATDAKDGEAYIGECSAYITAPVIVTGPVTITGCGSGSAWQFWSAETDFDAQDQACTQVIMDDAMVYPKAAFVIRGDGTGGYGRGYNNGSDYFGSEGVRFRNLLVRGETEYGGGSGFLLDGTYEDGKDCDDSHGKPTPDSCTCTPGTDCRAAVRDVMFLDVNVQKVGGYGWHNRGNTFDITWFNAVGRRNGMGNFFQEANTIWGDGTDCTGTCRPGQMTWIESFAWGCDRDDAGCVSTAGYCSATTTLPCLVTADCPESGTCSTSGDVCYTAAADCWSFETCDGIAAETCVADPLSPRNAWAVNIQWGKWLGGHIQGDWGAWIGQKGGLLWPHLEGENDKQGVWDSSNDASDGNIGALLTRRNGFIYAESVTAFEKCVQIGLDGDTEQHDGYIGAINLLQQCGDPGFCNVNTEIHCNEDTDCPVNASCEDVDTGPNGITWDCCTGVGTGTCGTDTCDNTGTGWALKVEDGGSRDLDITLGNVILNYWPGDVMTDANPPVIDDRCDVDGQCYEARLFPVSANVAGDVEAPKDIDVLGSAIFRNNNASTEGVLIKGTTGTDELVIRTTNTTAANIDMDTNNGGGTGTNAKIQVDHSGWMIFGNVDTGFEMRLSPVGSIHVESTDPCYKFKDDDNASDSVMAQVCAQSTDLDPTTDGDLTFSTMTAASTLTPFLTMDGSAEESTFHVPLTVEGAIESAPSANPTIELTDSDTDDDDVSASITAQATATGTGVEDIDFAINSQAGGTLVNWLMFDASAGTVIFNADADAQRHVVLRGYDAGAGNRRGGSIAWEFDAAENVVGYTFVSDPTAAPPPLLVFSDAAQSSATDQGKAWIEFSTGLGQFDAGLSLGESGSSVAEIVADRTDDDTLGIDVDNDGDYEARWSKWDYVGCWANGTYNATVGQAIGGAVDRARIDEVYFPVAVLANTLKVYVFAGFTDAGATGCAFALYGEPDTDGVAAQIVSAEGIDWTSIGAATDTIDETEVYIAPGVYYASFSCDDTSPGALARVWADSYAPTGRVQHVNIAAGEAPPATFDIDGVSQQTGNPMWFELYNSATEVKAP